MVASMDFVRRDSTRTCTVIGDSGSLRWNAIEGTVDGSMRAVPPGRLFRFRPRVTKPMSPSGGISFLASAGTSKVS